MPSKATPSGALSPEEQSKRSVIVGEGAGAAQYIDDMTQTFGGMSEGLEAAQTNTRESIVNSLSPELRSKADVYVGMGDTEPESITSKAVDGNSIEDFDTLMRRATTEEQVYITEEEYNKMIDVLNEELEERYNTDGPQPTSIDINKEIVTLEENREWSIEYDKQEVGRELDTIGNSMNDPDSKSIVENVITNSESVSKNFITVNYEMQKELQNKANNEIEYAKKIYKAYAKTGSLLMKIITKGKGKIPQLIAAIPVLFPIEQKAPLIKEGDYILYTTSYYESYGWDGLSTKHHNVMVFVEANEDGSKKEQGYVYTMDYVIDTPYYWPDNNGNGGHQLPTFHPVFKEEVC